jgi:hypothetical protein
VKACADAKTNDKDDCGAKRRSVAVELEVNHFVVRHIDHLSSRTLLLELKRRSEVDEFERILIRRKGEFVIVIELRLSTRNIHFSSCALLALALALVLVLILVLVLVLAFA